MFDACQFTMQSERLEMGRSTDVLARKDPGREASGEQTAGQDLNLRALRKTPGFMIRILQIQIFERFLEYFAALGLSPAGNANLHNMHVYLTVRRSELAGE